MRQARDVLDDMLVLSCQSGDARALELLARRWHPRLVRHAFRLTGNREAAADAAQEAWIGIVRGIRGIRDPAKFGSWAIRIVQNKSRDWIRKETRCRAAVERLENPDPVEESNPTAAKFVDSVSPETALLRESMGQLSEEQRVIVRLFYVEDRPVGEIADILGLPVGTVKSRLFYARRRLRESFEAARGETQCEEMRG